MSKKAQGFGKRHPQKSKGSGNISLNETKHQLFAFERFMQGTARGEDYISVARFMKRSGVLPEAQAAMSDRDLALILQGTNYLIEEGIASFNPGGAT